MTKAFFVTGGTIPAGSESYVERSADRELLEHLRRGRFCYVLNSRQMGKSSLCVRTMRRLEQEGVRCAFIDLTKIGGRNVTPEQWYAGIATEVARSLGLRADLAANWKDNQHLSPVQRLFAFLREVVLEQIEQNVAVFFDEIDATRSLAFSADEFFAAIRECYNRRAQDPIYDRLTFCLLGVAVPSDLINSPTSTPFNVGDRVYLRDFTLEEALGLAAGLGGSTSSVERVYHWTNGHPYLTQSLCAAVAEQGLKTVDEIDALVSRDLFEPKARETNINLADVANRAVHAGDLEPDPEKFRADLLSQYDRAWKGRAIPDDEANRVTALLKLSGMMRSEGGRLYVRNRIYRHVFDRSWVRENMPGQELRRQRRAFYVGALRTALIAFAVVAVISALALNNARLARIASGLAAEATRQRDTARYEAYVADVNLMKTAYDGNDFSLLGDLLTRTSQSPYRGIEWDYWNTQLHDAPLEADYPKGFGTVSFSSDGTQIAIKDSRAETGEIRSASGLKLISSIPRLPRSSLLGFFGGRFVVCDAAGRTAVPVYDAITNRKLYTLDLGTGAVLNTSCSAFGDSLIACWTRQGDRNAQDLTVWDGRSGTQRWHFRRSPEKRINTVTVSDDGNTVVYEEVDPSPANLNDYSGGRRLVVRDMRTNREIDDFPTGGVTDWLCMSSDGRYFAYTTYSGQLNVRDVRAKRTILSEASGVMTSGGFSRDGRRLLIVVPLEAKLLDLPSGRVVTEARGSISASLAPDGHSFAVTGAGTTRIYTDRNREYAYVRIPNTWACLRGTNDAGRLVVCTGQAIRQFDPNSLREVSVRRSVSSLATTSMNANWVLAATPGGGADIVSTSTGHRLCHVGTWCNPNGSFPMMDVTSDLKRIAIVDNSQNYVAIYDDRGRPLWRVDCSKSAATACRWSHHGYVLAVGTASGKVLLTRFDAGGIAETLSGPESLVGDMAFSPDDERMVVSAGDPDSYIFTVRDGSCVVAQGSGSGTQSVRFSPDGTRVLTGCYDGSVRLWDARTGRQVLVLTSGHSPLFNALFDPRGDRIWTSDLDGVVRAFRLRGT